jgi:hypothetical protein
MNIGFRDKPGIRKISRPAIAVRYNIPGSEDFAAVAVPGIRKIFAARQGQHGSAVQ